MSSICWPGYETKCSIATEMRRRAYLITFFLLLWAINLTVVILGLPFIFVSKVLSAKSRTLAEPAAGSRV